MKTGWRKIDYPVVARRSH